MVIIGREKEILLIKQYVTDMLETKKSGFIHLAGAPGTGKTMSVTYVLGELKEQQNRNVHQIYVNCLKVRNTKLVLQRIFHEIGLELPRRGEEARIMQRLETEFKKKQYIVVLDELDALQQSQNVDLIRTAINWPVILIGISNTLDLLITEKDVMKIKFKPYTSKALKDILLWHIKNDENYFINDEAVSVNIVSKKFANDSGDIRKALNAFKSIIDDSSRQKKIVNISSIANSIKKRQKPLDDETFPLAHQIVLTICAENLKIDYFQCMKLFERLCKRLGLGQICGQSEFRPVINILEAQGLICLKRTTGRHRKEMIYVTAGSVELDALLSKKDFIMDGLSEVQI